MLGGDSNWKTEGRIDPSELQVGHFVTRLDIPWRETHFPLQGVLIDDPAKKAWMMENCAWVVISDPQRPGALPVRPGRSGIAKSRGNGVRKPRCSALFHGTVTRETLDAALKTYDSLDDQVRILVRQFGERARIDIHSARKVVGELTEVLEHNLAALVWLTRIKERDDYTAQHCINVAILAIGLAHALDWKQRDVEYAGLAGLLHDLGKTRVDQSVLNKPGPLTSDEFEEIKRHTSVGYEMLKMDGNLPEPVAEAVWCHHERPDGSGYPRGLELAQIPRLGRLISIVDAYDAITSNRIYDPARSHHEALGVLWKERNRQFDGSMVETFTQFLGWVTPGTLVRLTDDRLAVVLRAKDGRGLYPLVQLLEPDGGDYRLGAQVDLATLRSGREQSPVRIDQVLPDGSEGVDIRALSLAF